MQRYYFSWDKRVTKKKPSSLSNSATLLIGLNIYILQSFYTLNEWLNSFCFYMLASRPQLKLISCIIVSLVLWKCSVFASFFFLERFHFSRYLQFSGMTFVTLDIYYFSFWLAMRSCFTTNIICLTLSPRFHTITK